MFPTATVLADGLAGTSLRPAGTMLRWCAPGTTAELAPRWTGLPIMTSWRAPQRATGGHFGHWRNVIRGQRSGWRGASSATGRWPKTSCRMRSCASGSTRRAGGPRLHSAPGSIASWSISASTRSAARPTCRSMPPSRLPMPDLRRTNSFELRRARPAPRRGDRRAAGASARRDRAHLSGRAQQCRGRGGARHLGLRASRHCWFAPSERCAPHSDRDQE